MLPHRHRDGRNISGSEASKLWTFFNRNTINKMRVDAKYQPFREGVLAWVPPADVSELASQAFKIEAQALYIRVEKLGHPTLFSWTDEFELVEHLAALGEMGFAQTTTMIKRSSRRSKRQRSVPGTQLSAALLPRWRTRASRPSGRPTASTRQLQPRPRQQSARTLAHVMKCNRTRTLCARSLAGVRERPWARLPKLPVVVAWMSHPAPCSGHALPCSPQRTALGEITARAKHLRSPDCSGFVFVN